MDQEITLNYPEPAEEEDLAIWSNKDRYAEKVNYRRTDNNMSLLITEFLGSPVRVGDRVFAYDNNEIQVGMGTINESGRCGMAIWGSEKFTNDKQGLFEGDPFVLKINSSNSNDEKTLIPENIHVGEGFIYSENEILVLSVKNQIEAPAEFYLAEGFPNPFNSSIQISYGVPLASHISMKIFDLAGREVAVLTDGLVETGHHKTVWDACMISSGVYWLRLSSSETVLTQKLILLR